MIFLNLNANRFSYCCYDIFRLHFVSVNSALRFIVTKKCAENVSLFSSEIVCAHIFIKFLGKQENRDFNETENLFIFFESLVAQQKKECDLRKVGKIYILIPSKWRALLLKTKKKKKIMKKQKIRMDTF